MTEIKLALADPRVQMRALELAVERLASTPLQGAMQILTHLRDSIADQVKPAIEEPAEWGSIVRARRVGYGSEDTTTLRWQRRNSVGDSWVSEPAGDLGVHYHSDWSYLRNVEVLRVGIGDQQRSAAVSNLLNEIHYLIQAWESIPAQRVHDLVTAFEIDAAADADA